MKLPHRSVFAIVAIVAFSCGGTLQPTAPTATWNGHGSRSPASVTVSIASVTLGDDCGASVSAGACADGPCGSPCQSSGLQLSLSSGPGNGAATLSVQSVELYDSRTGERVATLSPGAAQIWSDSGSYVSWDGRIAPSGSLSVSYPLAGLDWSSIAGDGSSAYETRFRLQVVVRVDGEERTLVSSDIGREPMVVT